MNSTFFKIIISNYNNIPYIKKCLDSILEQTFQDFKIIIVDDMSTDLSDKFCEMYSRKYPDKIVFIKPNKKLYSGGCRNIGIDYNINSKYTWVIDGDDYLLTNNALEIIYNNLKNEDLDLLQVNGKKYFLKTNNFKTLTERISINLDNITQCEPTCHWLCIAKSELFKKSKYLEECLVGQDLYHQYLLLDNIKTYKTIDDYIYCYVIQPNSTSNSEKISNIGQLRKKHRIYLFQQLKELYNKLNNINIQNNLMNRLNILMSKIKSEVNISINQSKYINIKKHIVIAMASIPSRKQGMLNVIDSLIDKCDVFCLWLNNYNSIPEELSKYKKLIIHLAKNDSDIKENGRYTWINTFPNSYYLTVDDDIVFPETYIDDIVNAIDKYNKKSIITYHGTIFKNNREIYYHYKHTVLNDTQVHRVGGGVMGFIPNEINFICPSIDELKTWDGDASISVWATQNNIKKYVIKHSDIYFKNQLIENTPLNKVNALYLNSNTRKKRQLIYKQIKNWEQL